MPLQLTSTGHALLNAAAGDRKDKLALDALRDHLTEEENPIADALPEMQWSRNALRVGHHSDHDDWESDGHNFGDGNDGLLHPLGNGAWIGPSVVIRLTERDDGDRGAYLTHGGIKGPGLRLGQKHQTLHSDVLPPELYHRIIAELPEPMQAKWKSWLHDTDLGDWGHEEPERLSRKYVVVPSTTLAANGLRAGTPLLDYPRWLPDHDTYEVNEYAIKPTGIPPHGLSLLPRPVAISDFAGTDGKVLLIHYSPHVVGNPESVTLDPTRIGQNPHSKAELKASKLPRTLFYLADADREPTVAGRRYTVRVPAGEVYDLNHDPAGFKVGAISGAQAMHRAHEAGHRFIFYGERGGTVVASFHPIDVKAEPARLSKINLNPPLPQNAGGPNVHDFLTPLREEWDKEWWRRNKAYATPQDAAFPPHHTLHQDVLADWLSEHDHPLASLAVREGHYTGPYLQHNDLGSCPFAGTSESKPYDVRGVTPGMEKRVVEFPQHSSAYLNPASSITTITKSLIHNQPVVVFAHRDKHNIGWHVFHAPVPAETLRAHIAELPRKQQRSWLRGLRKLRLSRGVQQAPAGGMIQKPDQGTPGQWIEGGKFRPEDRQGIRETREKVTGHAMPNISKEKPSTISRVLTYIRGVRARMGKLKLAKLSPLLETAITTTHAEPSTPRLDKMLEYPRIEQALNAHYLHLLAPEHLHKIEAVYDLPDDARLSTTPGVRTHDSIRKFFDAISERRLTDPELGAILKDPDRHPDEKIVYATNHLAQEARHYVEGIHAGGGSTGWYGTAVDALEGGLHRLLATNAKGQHVANHPVWGHLDTKTGKLISAGPGMILAKAVVAFTSGGLDPVNNVALALRMLRAGKEAAGPKAANVFAHIPEHNTPKFSDFLRQMGIPQANIGHTPQEWFDWYTKNRPAIKAIAKGNNNPGYRTCAVAVLNGKAVARIQSNKWNPEPGFEAVTKKTPGVRVYQDIPKGSDEGTLLPGAWSTRPSIVSGLRSLNQLIDAKGMEGASHWLLTDHTNREFREVFGKVPERGYLPKDEPLPGSFIFGEKFGPFLLNLHGNTKPELGRYLTPDMWWSRTWNRYMGSLSNAVNGEANEVPKNPAERRAMFEAAKRATKLAGLENVSNLQAALWYYEQNLWKTLGAKGVQPYSYLDGINHALKQAGVAGSYSEDGQWNSGSKKSGRRSKPDGGGK